MIDLGSVLARQIRALLEICRRSYPSGRESDMATRQCDAMSHPIISVVPVGGRLGATFSRGMSQRNSRPLLSMTPTKVTAPRMPSFAQIPHWMRISFNRTLEASAGWIAVLMRMSSS